MLWALDKPRSTILCPLLACSYPDSNWDLPPPEDGASTIWATGTWAGNPGFEPELTGPEPVVIPITLIPIAPGPVAGLRRLGAGWTSRTGVVGWYTLLDPTSAAAPMQPTLELSA